MVHQNFHLLLPYLPQGPGLGSESLVSLTFPLPHGLGLGFPGGSDGKEFTCNAGDLGSIPGLGRSAGEGNGYPFQYSGLENSTDYIVHRVTESWTRLSDFHCHGGLTISLSS